MTDTDLAVWAEELATPDLPTAALDGPAVPVLDGIQFQGDVLVRPQSTQLPPVTSAVPIGDGLPVLDTGSQHILRATQGVTWRPAATPGRDLGVLTVPTGGVAWLIHTEEHHELGIGPGKYVLRRQSQAVEEAPAVRLAPTPAPVTGTAPDGQPWYRRVEWVVD